MPWLRLLALAPVVAAVVIAGVVSSPAKVRPCVTEYSIPGSPTHLISGPGGGLYAAEEPQRAILRFGPDSHRARQYKLPVQPHDLTAGPDGRVWFVSYLESRMGALDPRTGKVTMYPGISQGSEPHMLRFSNDGKLYITEQKAGRLARFDPKTHEIREGAFGLPPGNYIHNLAKLPNGDFWAVLQQGDALARFSLKKQRFDKFVKVPVKDGGPRDIAYVRSRNAVFATLFAGNQLVEYDLDSGRLKLHRTHLDPIKYSDALSRKSLPKLTFVRPDAQERALWIATLAGGELLRMDLKTNEIKRVGCGITVPSGVLGLANDDKGRLWFAVTFPRGRLARVKM